MNATPQGIVNIGNTCYINSVLQLFFQCNTIIHLILETNFNDSTVLFSLVEIIVKYFKNETPLNPHKFIKLTSKITYQQEDAHEYLLHLLNLIDDELKKTGTTLSSLVKHKYLTLIQSVESDNSQKIQSQELVLSLPIAESLQTAYQLYCQEEIIEEWENETKKFKAKKVNVVSSWPQYLFIVFKKYNNESKKIETEINIPIIWKIKNLHKNKVVLNIYKLKGVVIHVGNTHFGHYFTVLLREDKYYICDDMSVDEIEEKEATELIKNAYICLYELE